MTTPVTHALATTALVTAAALGGCSTDSDGSDGGARVDDRTAAVAALSAALAADADPGDGSDPLLAPEETDCQAAALVDELGVDGLVDEGILDAALTEATLPQDATSTAVKRANAAAISDCVGIVDYTLRLTRTVLAKLATQEGGERFRITDEQWADVVACAEERLPEAGVRERAVGHPDQPLLSEQQLAKLAPCEPTVFGK